MKRLILISLLFSTLLVFSQKEKNQKLNYNFTVNATFGHNDHFGEYDEYTDEKDKSFFAIKSVFVRTGLDIKINKLFTTGINIGIDTHTDPNFIAIPYYLDTKITISQLDDDVFYFGGGVGKLLKLGKAFEKGDYYKFGIGYHISTDKAHKFILNLDFHQKNILGFEGGRLQSLSLGMGMLFL